MSLHGFRLSQAARNDGFSGGVMVASSLGHDFNVAKALGQTTDEFGNSQIDPEAAIYTNDDLFADRLRGYPALQEIPVEYLPADPPVVEVPGAADLVNPPVPSPRVTPEDYVPEIPAEHADEPNTPEAAIKAGEAVAGPPKTPGDNQITDTTSVNK